MHTYTHTCITLQSHTYSFIYDTYISFAIFCQKNPKKYHIFSNMIAFPIREPTHDTISTVSSKNENVIDHLLMGEIPKSTTF